MIRLVVAGRIDRDIAEELITSVTRVGNHVRNILNKSASANRTKAEAYAIRHRLAPEEESQE